MRDASGVNLVEAALITPLLLLLTLAIVDFASMLYIYLTLENGISQASRYAVTGRQIDGSDREASIRTAMKQATPTIYLDDDAFTFSHLPQGSTTWSAGSGGPNDIGKVTVDYTWNLMTPLIRPFFANGQIHFTVESAMKNERRFD